MSEPSYEDRQKIEEIAKSISLLGSKVNADYLISLINIEHRTNQQRLFKNFIVPLMKNYSVKTEGQYDLRNEDTVLFCKKIKEQLDDSYFCYI